MIELSNGTLKLLIDSVSGHWLFLGNNAGNVLGKTAHVFEVYMEDKPIFGLDRVLSEVRREVSSHSIQLIYERAGLRAVHSIALERDHVMQSVTLECVAGGERLLTEIRYMLTGLAMGNPADCLLQLPGQLLPPDTPYVGEAVKPLDRSAFEPHPDYPQGWLESAPDQTSGLIAVENRRLGKIVSVWMHSERAVVFPTLDGEGERISTAHRYKLTDWLRPGSFITSEPQYILFTEGSLENHLFRFRELAYGDRLQSVPDKADWLKDARLLQMNPRPVSLWRARLSEYWELGFNTLYLLPVWANTGNPYSLMDHYQIDDDINRSEEWDVYPEGFCERWDNNPFPVGSAEELRMFVDEAHAYGFRVLFDLIPQGISISSQFAREHAEWLVRDELGRPHASHGWGPQAGEPETGGGTYSMDWGNPEYRDFIVKWALWNVETFDIDGFRTDAMHWKEANRFPSLQRPAWMTTFGGIRLIEELRPALKALKPEAVLISEVWGPIFQRAHDVTYENGWLLARINTGWLTDTPVMTGAQWSRHLALAALARPKGLVRAIFGANHDLELFVKLAKSHLLGDAVQFIHIFSDGIPFIWYKEVEHREATFRALLSARAQLSGYVCHYGLVTSSATDVFTSVWSKPGKSSILATANLSSEQVMAILTIQTEIGLTEKLAPTMLNGFGFVSTIYSSENGTQLTLPPSAYALFEL